MRSALIVWLGFLSAAVLGLLCLTLGLLSSGWSLRAQAPTPSSPRASQLGIPADTEIQLEQWQRVEDFDQEMAQFKTVFWEPRDTASLRKLMRETPLVHDKTVLEIGTGTGLVALCAVVAGAKQVVATDVNPAAIANARYNAEILNQHDRLDTRLVPVERAGAYSVIDRAEVFDLIISNPPWEDQQPGEISEYALYDNEFALLHALLKDLKRHLAPRGKLLLAYGCVSAVRRAQQLAAEFDLRLRILDDRSLDELTENFLPGMLLEVTVEEG